MIVDYIILALINIKKRGVRSWLTMLGIFIGIAAVVSLISLGNGLQTAITGQFDTLDPDKLTVQNKGTGFGPPGSTVVEKLNSHDVELIKGIQGVELVIPRLIRIVGVEYNKATLYQYVASMPEDQESIDVVYDAANIKIEEGEFLAEGDRGKIILGNDFKDENLFGKEIRLNKQIKIQGKEFKVVGFAEKSSSFQINSVILMMEEDMKEILKLEDEYDLLVVQVKEMNELNIVKEKIEDEMREDRNLDTGEEDFSVETPQQAIESINTILSIIKIVVSGIAAISLIVGGVGIMNTMYTSVLERRKEIGLMKAVGATNRDVLLIFLIESSILGILGGLIGAAIGITLAYLVSFSVTQIFPGLNFGVAFSIPLFSLAILFSLIVGVVSGILPALQAAKLRPVEALRI